ncbi:MAG: hypothetical protein WCW53_01470 [Syntrophales bacterium]|jgi:hypothetical protein
MAIRKIISSQKPIICLGIMMLCLLTGTDDISGFWQPSNINVPMIQSGNGQADTEDHSVKAVFFRPAWRDASNVAQQLSFSQAYLEEIKWQISLIYLSPSHARAPPSFS